MSYVSLFIVDVNFVAFFVVHEYYASAAIASLYLVIFWGGGSKSNSSFSSLASSAGARKSESALRSASHSGLCKMFIKKFIDKIKWVELVIVQRLTCSWTKAT